MDGAHAPAFTPLDLDAIDADFYGSNCHKWLLAPTGSGFLYLGRGSAERIQPLQVSWGWRRDPNLGPDDRDELGSTPRLRQLEFEGTRDPCPWLAIPSAIGFQADIGWGRVRGLGELPLPPGSGAASGTTGSPALPPLPLGAAPFQKGVIGRPLPRV